MNRKKSLVQHFCNPEFSCNIFTISQIIIKRNWLNRLFCYNTDILHYHWLCHFPVACQRLIVSHFFVICCKTVLMKLCFYGDYIAHVKLCKNFCVSNFKCNFLDLTLNLKSLTHVQFHITIIIIFITKEASWCKIFQTDTSPR